MKLNYCSACNFGAKRRNEDAIGARVFEDCDKSLFIVCDGMSGLHSGDMASQTVVDVFLSIWEKHRGEFTIGKLLGMAVEQAKVEIDKISRYDVGTTMVMAAMDDEEMLIAHLGDSRAYYLHPDNGLLYQTQDHITFGKEGWPYVSKGFFNFRDMENPTVRKFQCKHGDRILLCSDGVSGCYKNSTLTDLVSERMEIDTIMSNIIGYCDEYATDNYSAILIEVQ